MYIKVSPRKAAKKALFLNSSREKSTGSAFGPLIGFPLCGYLTASSGGWPSVFYVTGGFGFVWVMLWLWIGANSPKEHRTISHAEKMYIEAAIKDDVKLTSVRNSFHYSTTL